MKISNMGIRLEARGAGVPLWRIAKELLISEPTLTRLLREPLSKEMETRIRKIIHRIEANNQ